jgi:hypothetical protein
MPTGFGQVKTGVAIVGALLTVSCGSETPNQPTPLPPLPPTPVSLSRVDVRAPDSIELQRSTQLSATAVRSDGSTEDVSSQAQWTSSNSSVVRISASGEATALRSGEVTISARYQIRTGSASVVALPAGTHKLTGTVTEEGRAVDGVLVTVISGTGSGLSTITGGGGRFTLFGVAGHVTLQAKKEGYLNRLTEVNVNAATTHNFDVVPASARLNLAGNYTLTLESPCEGFLDPSERRRTYAAALAQQGPELTLTVSGADIVINNGQGNTFGGSLGVTDDVVFGFGSFTVAYYYYYYFGGVTSATGLVERLSASAALIFSGSVSARATGSSISGRLRGMSGRQENGRITFPCIRDHPFEMRRR